MFPLWWGGPAGGGCIGEIVAALLGFSECLCEDFPYLPFLVLHEAM